MFCISADSCKDNGRTFGLILKTVVTNVAKTLVASQAGINFNKEDLGQFVSEFFTRWGVPDWGRLVAKGALDNVLVALSGYIYHILRRKFTLTFRTFENTWFKILPSPGILCIVRSGDLRPLYCKTTEAPHLQMTLFLLRDHNQPPVRHQFLKVSFTIMSRRNIGNKIMGGKVASFVTLF